MRACRGLEAGGTWRREAGTGGALKEVGQTRGKKEGGALNERGRDPKAQGRGSWRRDWMRGLGVGGTRKVVPDDGLTGVGRSPPLPFRSILVNPGVRVCSEEPSLARKSPHGCSGA